MADELLSAGGERTLTAVAETFRSIADDLERGEAIHLESGERTATVALAEPVSFELEVERETNGSSTVEFELELEWTEPAEAAVELEEGGGLEESAGESGVESEAEADASSAPSAGSADATEDTEGTGDAAEPDEVESLGQFQLFTDRAGEWRWRLVHRNGNVIASSGEGYTTKRNAEKGMHSVMRNAPGADAVDVDSS